jgi:hypothetical protein
MPTRQLNRISKEAELGRQLDGAPFILQLMQLLEEIVDGFNCSKVIARLSLSSTET